MTRPIFDAHFHIIDPRFPLQANQGYLPSPFTVKDYLTQVQGLNIQGGVVVSGSFQGMDQSYLRNTLPTLGKKFVGITQIAVTATDQELQDLHQIGIRGVRFNLHRGGSEVLTNLETLAHRVHDLLGWHVELYIDSQNLPELSARLEKLPALSIDHLGLSQTGFPHLLRLVEKGVRVKASGFGRGDLDIPAALQELSQANPEALMFGTDLPCTRSPRPFQTQDMDLILETLGNDLSQKIFWDNAQKFYRMAKVNHT